MIITCAYLVTFNMQVYPLHVIPQSHQSLVSWCTPQTGIYGSWKEALFLSVKEVKKYKFSKECSFREVREG